MSLDRVRSPRLRALVLGALFGVAATAAMLAPFVLAEGVMFDMRSLPVGLAGAFVGPVGAAVAMLPAAAMRLWIGGDGAAAGVMSLAIAGLAGIAWRLLAARVRLGALLGLVLLGAMVSLHLLSLLALPRPLALAALGLVAPTILALNIAGTLVVGSLIVREDRHAQRFRSLVRETLTDPLTGIANRRGFERRTRERRSRGGRSGHAVLFIDVDRFKSINDSFGHSAGDAILRQLGARLGKALRAEDVVARFGGEEFAVYLADTSRAETGVIADRLRRTVAATPFQLNGTGIPVTISVGVHWQREPVVDWERIFLSTDRALYAAKAAGRDRVVFDDLVPSLAAA